MTLAVDLFAGPGGWDVAAEGIEGLETVGIEFDKWACQTRRAAGLETIEGDVRHYGPADFPTATGLIASPPCQTFSLAGKGAGRSALDLVLKCINDMYWGNPLPADAFEDDRTALVLEPLRWALEAHLLGRPFEWLAFEQVPTVLPVWVSVAKVLRRIGYTVETGNVQAEQYGVPQTRKRAILVARLNGSVALPTPTHSKYHNRTPGKLDEGVLKWVSMAEALGWGQGELVGFPRRWDNMAGEPVEINGVEYRGRDLREATAPAQVVTEKARSWNRYFVATNQPRATLRDPDQPAPTLAFGHEAPRWVLRTNNTEKATERDLGQPAPTLHFGERKNYCAWESRPVEEQPAEGSWAYDRPSTTIVGSFRPDIIAAPGWRKAGDGPRQNAVGSIQVTAEEASVLQSFAPDYPWAGAKSKQFQQIGNAIPPLLAEAILREVTRA